MSPLQADGQGSLKIQVAGWTYQHGLFIIFKWVSLHIIIVIIYFSQCVSFFPPYRFLNKTAWPNTDTLDEFNKTIPCDQTKTNIWTENNTFKQTMLKNTDWFHYILIWAHYCHALNAKWHWFPFEMHDTWLIEAWQAFKNTTYSFKYPVRNLVHALLNRKEEGHKGVVWSLMRKVGLSHLLLCCFCIFNQLQTMKAVKISCIFLNDFLWLAKQVL